MTVKRATFRLTLSSCRKAGVTVLGLAALLFWTPAALAAAVPGDVTTVTVSANGSVPGNTQSITLTHNGISTPVSHIGNMTPFISDSVSLPGPPGTVTNVLTISIPDPADWTMTHTAFISVVIDTTTGAVTVSGSDPEGTILGTSMTLTADGSAGASPVSDTFMAAATGDPGDRTLNVCATFDSGVQFCMTLSLLDETPVVPPVDDTVFEAAINSLANSNYADAFRMMTEQLSTIMIQQLPILGTFFDAKHQLETQRLFGLTAAAAHRDYQPSEQLCAFGTLARSTAISKYEMQQNALAMNTILQKRELLNAYVSSAWGPYADSMSRMAKFKTLYCNPNDNNADYLPQLCAPTDKGRMNKDVDYRRTLESHLTLDINMTDGLPPTEDEADILALAKNLFAHTTFTSIEIKNILPYGAYREFHNTRMLSAIRSVARHSFTTLAAMRMAGSGMSSTQLKQVMENLGVPAGDIDALIGANPSYFAQMDILTQKMFQDPAFMINLYSGPANVARMGVVLQGIRIMADRDRLDAALRREMLISMILEMKIRERENAIKNLARRPEQ